MMLHVLVYSMTGILIVVGLTACIMCENFIKKMMGLAIFQTSTLLIYIAIGFVENSRVPIIKNSTDTAIYSNPLTHVLMLTAIVVGVATMSLGLAIIVRIWKKYSSIEEQELQKLDSDQDS